ncbi:MAG TPA: L-seryl-tRNA(Sec) selenium transferase [Gammaproteobacteria bacterium]|nr:L-seryl-tRNA(Sec) selenium transferase [Gammaproteobacteria bacterium]
MSSNTETSFKLLPAIEKLLQATRLQAVIEGYGHDSVKLEARSQLQVLREAIVQQNQDALDWLTTDNFFDELCHKIEEAVRTQFSSSLIPVFNLTGTVVHTNLGRAKLPQIAIEAIITAATQATNLEYDLESGKRGDRDSHLEQALCNITGAESATVVNNNAAAVVLVLNTLAFRQEVPISRGELVEIGGAFRIPDVMNSAGCHLKEVGTTNRTHMKDYVNAINDNTALVMKVHTSNYKIKGFTNSVSESELAQLAREKDIPFISDLGSGTLIDLKQFGLPYEPTVKEVLDSGANVVTFSGDKLLGGPQAGIIVGSRELITRIKQNPLKRALRIDKITLAALLEVINLYKDPQRLAERLPLLADLTRSPAAIEETGNKILPHLQDKLAGWAKVTLGSCKSQIGSGALPLDLLESRALIIEPIAAKGETDAHLLGIARSMRALPMPVIGRISDGKLLFDLRCLRDINYFVEQLDLIQLGVLED